MNYVINPPAQASVPVVGSADRFPVRRIYCVGRNYVEHAKEMGFTGREAPFFFMKPADAVVPAAGTVPFPPMTGKLHHEVELIVAIGRGGANIEAASALGHVWGYAAGVDLTRRDLQDVAKKAARPWEWAKAFDASGPSTPLVPKARVKSVSDGRIWLSVNGELRQQGDLNELIWPVPDIIAHVSQSVALAPGDIIFTGTPAGVGKLDRGDRLTGGVEGVAEFDFTIDSAG